MKRRHGQKLARAAFRLSAAYPATDLGNPLDPLDDLIYLVLSGQTNESNYQTTFGALKKAFPRWDHVAAASVENIRKHIAGGGLDQQKAAYIKDIITRVKADFGTATLASLETKSDQEVERYLTSLPGVGIKTARCVMMYTLDRDVFPIDIHGLRILDRLGVVDWNGERAELRADEAQAKVPAPLRRSFHIDLIQHGRAVCRAREPKCVSCLLSDLCAHASDSARYPTVVDLCCGAGGYSWGFMQAGFDVLLGVDVWQSSLDTYALNIPGAATLKLDITSRDAVKYIKAKLGKRTPKVVIAGTPCQGFSRAGPRDPDDERNSVLHAAMRVAVRLNPHVIVFENVMNLRTQSFVHHLRSAEGVLRRAGYSFRHAVMNARAFGVSQTRKRLILVGVRDGCPSKLTALLTALAERPEVDGTTVEAALAKLDAERVDVKSNHDPMAHSVKVRRKIEKIKPGSGPLSYRKLDPAEPAATLICGHRAMPCHYATPRTITVREAARIQSFPDEFRFTGPRGHQMQQVANAVPPKLALAVGMMVHDLLKVEQPDHLKNLIGGVLSRVTIRKYRT